MINPLHSIFNLFYPELCSICKSQLVKGEKAICISCISDLPITNFCNLTNNTVETSFYGRIPIEEATALFYFFKKGSIQELIHNLKYRNQQQVGTVLGEWLGDDLLQSNRFKNLDFIVPVPLHQKKMKKRGYNQVTTFGQSLSKKLNVPYNDTILKRITSTKTQTKRLRFDRWKNVQELFVVEQPEFVENKHILLIDDIITTGATLEACCKAFENSKNIKISIACMAYTK